MEKAMYMTKKCKKIVGPIVFIAILLSLSMPLFAAEQAASEKELGAMVARDWIAVGIKQMDKGFYEQAEQSFVSALDYQQSLSETEQKKLNDYLAQAHAAALQSKTATETMKQADSLVKRGQLLEAKQKLETAAQNPTMDKGKQLQLSSKLKDVNAKIDEQKKQIDDLYQEALRCFEKNDIANARDYLAKIDQLFAKYAEQNKLAEEAAKEEKNQPAAIVKPQEEVMQENSPEDLVKEKLDEANDKSNVVVEANVEENQESKQQKVLISYINAVVSDSIKKANGLIEENKPQDAKSVIESTLKILDESKAKLPAESYEANKAKLDEIEQGLVGSK